MPTLLDYHSRPTVPRMDRAFCGLVIFFYLAALLGEVIMPRSAHRDDPLVDWAVFLAQISAAGSELLFIWGCLEITRRGIRSLSRNVIASWIAAGVLPPVSFLLTRSGGRFLYV